MASPNEWTRAAAEVLKAASFSPINPSSVATPEALAQLCLKLGLQIAGQGAVFFTGIMWQLNNATDEKQKVYESKEKTQAYVAGMAKDAFNKFAVAATNQNLGFLFLRFAFAIHRRGADPTTARDLLLRSVQEHGNPQHKPEPLAGILRRSPDAHALLPSLGRLMVCYAHAFDDVDKSEAQEALKALTALMYILIWARFSAATLDDAASDDALCAMFLNIVAQSTETSLSTGTAADKKFLEILQAMPTAPLAAFASAQTAVVSAHVVQNGESAATMAATFAATYAQANRESKTEVGARHLRSATAAVAVARAVMDATSSVVGGDNGRTPHETIINKAVSNFREGGYAMKALVVLTTPVWLFASFAAFVGGAAVILTAVVAVVLIAVCWCVYALGKELVAFVADVGVEAVRAVQYLVNAGKESLTRLLGFVKASAAPSGLHLTTLRLLHARVDALLLEA